MKLRSRISPHLERCALLLSANESFLNAETDIEVLTGLKVSHGTQHRMATENQLAWSQSPAPVSDLSLDGGKVRLRTPLGEASQWRDYKAVALHGQVCGAAFQENEALAQWVRQQPLATQVSVVGDGHPGVWKLAADCVDDDRRDEVLDWYPLMENRHQVGGFNQRLEAVRSHLWLGDVEAARTEFRDWRALSVLNFESYLERHQERLPNYAHVKLMDR